MRRKNEKEIKVKVILYAFWLLDTVLQATDRLNFGHREGNSGLSMSMHG